jgi:hypothetical protein
MKISSFNNKYSSNTWQSSNVHTVISPARAQIHKMASSNSLNSTEYVALLFQAIMNEFERLTKLNSEIFKNSDVNIQTMTKELNVGLVNEFKKIVEKYKSQN